MARYDTTSFNVYHAPEGAEPGGILAFGHSKDKRPDLLQFKQGLGTLDPAGVPIFTETINGNKADDPLYLGAWRTMGQTLGRNDFLLVADCKAAALETRCNDCAGRGVVFVSGTTDGEDAGSISGLDSTATGRAQRPCLGRRGRGCRRRETHWARL